MTARAHKGKRSLVPRWRYTARTPFTAELQGDPTRSIAYQHGESTLHNAQTEWARERSYATAVDFLFAAITHGRPNHAREAAQYLNDLRGLVAPQLSSTVDWILAGSPGPVPRIATHPNHPTDGHIEARSTIAHARSRLRVFARNPKHWIDLSLAYATMGDPKRAERAMRTGLALAPNHRLLMRTYARMLVHFDRVDEAHDFIRRHPRTASDPWLIATEISLANLAKRPSALVLKGRRIALDSVYSPEHLSELASAAALFEEGAGSHRRVQRLHEVALRVPTDNVLAHLEFLAQSDRSIKTAGAALTLPQAMEARFWRAQKDGRFESALQEAIAWQVDEPTSSRAAIASSYLAGAILGDAKLGVACAEEGLKSNPSDQLLRNNLVVAHARCGNAKKAVEEFRKIRMPLDPGYDHAVFQATRGLVSFIEGNIEQGRADYEAACKSKDPQIRALAAISWFETEAIYVPSQRDEIRRSLLENRQRIEDPASKAIENRLIKALTAHAPIIDTERAATSGNTNSSGGDLVYAREVDLGELESGSGIAD